MYGLSGKLTAKPGKRTEFVQILLKAATVVGEMPGCHAYIVSEDAGDEVSIWIFEVWADKETHDQSLQNESVRALIGQAMPLMAGAPEQGQELKIMGGHGI